MPRGRLSTARRSLVLGAAGPLASALAALAFLRVAWWVIFQVRIGPVVATVTGSHGVHSGDVLGVGSAVLGLAFAAGAYSLSRRPRPARVPVSRR